MSIKSDRWIRRMALEHGMIEPFAPEQVRQANGHRIVSYGTSSYGYDVRCANEFKIFTNINSTIVDPKRFDEKSFVDFTGDVCIIPPNSFALARTVEYFRIPRSVLTVCLGKCLTADTRVLDAVSGAYVPIAEMTWGRRTLGLAGWVMEEAAVAGLIPQGRQPVFELRTRAGLRIRATANHPFRTLHGWTALADLQAGDRIAAVRHIPVFGSTPLPDWEATLLGLMISEGRCSTPGHSPTFTNSDPALVRLLEWAVDAGGLGTITDRGRFGWRLVNRRGRGGRPERNRAGAWLKQYGLDVGAADKFVPQALFMAPRESVQRFLQALFGGDGGVYATGDSFFLEYYSKSRRLIEDVHHLLLRFGIFSLMREKTTVVGTRVCSIQITDRDQILRFAERIGFPEGSLKQQRLEQQLLPRLLAQGRIQSNCDTLPKEAWSVLLTAARSRGTSMNALGVRAAGGQSFPFGALQRVASATHDRELEALLDGPVWDVVKEIVPAGEAEVFDICVPRLRNFIANDLFVHNSTYARCGVIVNVTPLEPEWEGHVTLEFSNTTPLPAKIYANEGVAQMLFFESDEVCETSYRDRGGKYMGQRGVTLPKT